MTSLSEILIYYPVLFLVGVVLLWKGGQHRLSIFTLAIFLAGRVLAVVNEDWGLYLAAASELVLLFVSTYGYASLVPQSRPFTRHMIGVTIALICAAAMAAAFLDGFLREVLQQLITRVA